MDDQQVDHQQESPPVLNYEHRPNGAPSCSSLVHQSYKVAIVVGLCIAICALVPIIGGAQEGALGTYWRDPHRLMGVSIFIGVAFALGVSLVWLGYRSGKGSTAAAYGVSGVLIAFAMALGLGIYGMLTDEHTGGDDEAIAYFCALLFLAVAGLCLATAWAQFRWIRHLKIEEPLPGRR